MLVLFLSFCESQDGDWLIYDKYNSILFYLNEAVFLAVKRAYGKETVHLSNKRILTLQESYKCWPCYPYLQTSGMHM